MASENDQKNMLLRLEKLESELKELKEQLSEARLAQIIRNAVDPFFRFQNEKIDGHAAYFSSDDKIFRFSTNGVTFSFYLPLGAADQIQKDILRTAYFYQPKPLNFIQQHKLVGASSVVLDVGANIGNHTVFFGRAMDVKKVHSFEPNPPAFAILQKNVELNGLHDVVELHQVGVGAKSSRARNLNTWSSNLGGNQIADDEAGDVRIERIDDLSFSKVDFIKIDVEGRGDGVINGAISTISRDKPVLLVEETSDPEKAAISMLKSSFGYREIWRRKLDVILTV